MEYFDKEFCLEVWGDFACFTRPELKVERVSYEVITPSAARAIFEAIFWKDAIRWEVTKIEILNPIKWTSIRRNEVGSVGRLGGSCIYIDEIDSKGKLKNRQQRNSLLLKDVRYRIYAKLIFIPVCDRKEMKHKPGFDENPGKYNAMFERRARKGQCFNQPYLGTREFSASFRLIEDNEEMLSEPIQDNKNLGLMHYDMDFSNPKNILPMYFRAEMKNGVINVPPFNSSEILR
jgi:CRISPR-associated protein Cas5d